MVLELWCQLCCPVSADAQEEEGWLFGITPCPILLQYLSQEREVWPGCQNQQFRPLLKDAIGDAIPIVGWIISRRHQETRHSKASG
ncbi:hypothetical protein BJY01DRAFT_230440 [Aspergillus pseudoustus]|uniref:Uncharacterized protein n=1 Tax=Aspergillus pseudoustus TaxID=1810923 RepID=A0ABR4IA56_9EURO